MPESRPRFLLKGIVSLKKRFLCFSGLAFWPIQNARRGINPGGRPIPPIKVYAAFGTGVNAGEGKYTLFELENGRRYNYRLCEIDLKRRR
jgi:hypothetical protein